MSRKIEEAFNDCFERLLLGESLESCLSRYPEFASELDSMLRTSFEVKRRSYPIQPRPEFKYWGRVRLQNTQQSMSSQDTSADHTPFNWRRNLAISMAALLVFVIASSGTAVASADALPDHPLYNVKLAVEQVQLTLTPAETDKAELYANLAAKRAQEIAIMATQGKTDKVVSTTERMYYELDQAEQLLVKSEIAATTPTVWFGVSKPSSSDTLPPTTTSIVPPATTDQSPTPIAPDQTTPILTLPSEQQGNMAPGENTTKSLVSQRTISKIDKVRTAINASNDKSRVILQNALEKSPASVKPNLNEIIEKTKTINERINSRSSSKINIKTMSPNNKSDNRDKDDKDDREEIDKNSPRSPDKKKGNTPYFNWQSDINERPNSSAKHDIPSGATSDNKTVDKESQLIGNTATIQRTNPTFDGSLVVETK